MAELTTIIPQHKFEHIRDRIGAILAVEISNQVQLMNNDSPPQDGDVYNATVWVERFIPFDKTELPAINVSLIEGTYDNEDVRSSQGTYNYAVDVHVSSKSGNGSAADKRAALIAQRLVGMCRAIIKNPKHRTLGFTPPYCYGVTVRKFEFGNESQDALSSVVGRLTVEVKAPECVELVDGVELLHHSTTVKLYETEKGFHYGIQDDPDPLLSEDSEPLIAENNIDSLIPE